MQTKLWVDVIKGNHLSTNGTEISYTTPLIVNREVYVVIKEQRANRKIIMGRCSHNVCHRSRNFYECGEEIYVEYLEFCYNSKSLLQWGRRFPYPFC